MTYCACDDDEDLKSHPLGSNLTKRKKTPNKPSPKDRGEGEFAGVTVVLLIALDLAVCVLLAVHAVDDDARGNQARRPSPPYTFITLFLRGSSEAFMQQLIVELRRDRHSSHQFFRDALNNHKRVGVSC